MANGGGDHGTALDFLRWAVGALGALCAAGFGVLWRYMSNVTGEGRETRRGLHKRVSKIAEDHRETQTTLLDHERRIAAVEGYASRIPVIEEKLDRALGRREP